MRGALVGLALVVIAACSSPSQSTFTLAGASVDPTYYCPGGASNVPYDLHATVAVHNGSSQGVAVRAATAQMTVTAIKGVWLEKVGDRYDAGNVKFTPVTVAPGRNTTLKLTIASACTSGRYGTGTSSSAQYKVVIHLATSAGNFSVTAANEHEIVAD